MSKGNGVVVSVKIVPTVGEHPPGKLADAEVIFEAASGPLSGLRLVGFAIWERRSGGKNVTFPSRPYSKHGERRNFTLLRPANGEANAQDPMRDFILDAYNRIEAQA